MLNIEQVGINIMKQRKKLGITQMELAERLGISFQAVSNWERGMSCPDIAKLMELSALFGVSVDELIDNTRIARLASDIAEEKEVAITTAELEDIAPILNQAQIDRAADGISDIDNIDADELKLLAPYLDDDFISEVVIKIINTKGIEEAKQLMPFADEDTIADHLRKIGIENISPEDFRHIAPYMDEDFVSEAAWVWYGKNGISAIKPILTFIDEDILTHHIREIGIDKISIDDLTAMAPYLDEDFVSEVVIELSRKHGFSYAKPLLPYIDEDIIQDYLLKKWSKKEGTGRGNCEV